MDNLSALGCSGSWEEVHGRVMPSAFIGRVWKPDVRFVLRDLTEDYSPDSKIIKGIKKAEKKVAGRRRQREERQLSTCALGRTG